MNTAASFNGDAAASPPAAKRRQDDYADFCAVLFFASGAAGLIYESVWARYLKTFLGHAAFAWALTLGVFLLGLAAGAAIAGRFCDRLPRPLLLYAFAELIATLIAFSFHDIFLAVTGWAYGLMPALSPTGGEFFRWSLAALLLLPGAVALGTTFPLMSATLTRRNPSRAGGVVARLYFVNALGAVAGAMFSGFWLLPNLGLEGALFVGALISGAVGAAAAGLSKYGGEIRASAPRAALAVVEDGGDVENKNESGGRNLTAFILIAAFTTGLASFVYEIVWLRMLALLLGSATYVFELVVAVFILGLAIGGALIQRRADVGDPLRRLAKVQLIMGVLAAASLVYYQQLFSVLGWALQQLPRSGEGYDMYLAVSAAMAVAMIFPASVCAGMTLPLLARRLMASRGEGAVGAVYAANTVGAVGAAFVTVFVLMPWLGIRGAMLAGAGADLTLALVLYFIAARIQFRRALGIVAAAMAAGLLAPLNPNVLHAGVFRHLDALKHAKTRELLYEKHGRTASVSVMQSGNAEGLLARSIFTNGKSDASISYNPNRRSGDEMTMVLSGLIPLMTRPNARLAANVGLGSGLTSHTMMHWPGLERLDNVEIEPAMAEGARLFGEKTERLFSDPRSKIHFGDAKTFFARTRGQYDIIISEPSNPWVSGVAGLFTYEFYRAGKAALNDGGVWLQWFHLYESAPQLLASVMKSLGAVFADYRFYLSTTGDLIILAGDKLPPLSGEIFNNADAAAFLRSQGFNSADDVRELFLGDAAMLRPYFEFDTAPPNSDFFPFLEFNAHRAFFMKTQNGLNYIKSLPVPVVEMLSGHQTPHEVSPHANSPFLREAAAGRARLRELDEADSDLQQKVDAIAAAACETDEEKTQAVLQITSLVSPLQRYARDDEMARLWQKLDAAPCVAALLNTLPQSSDAPLAEYLRLWRALSLRDMAGVAEAGDKMLAMNAEAAAFDFTSESGEVVLLATALAHHMEGRHEKASQIAALGAKSSNAFLRHALQIISYKSIAALAGDN